MTNPKLPAAKLLRSTIALAVIAFFLLKPSGGHGGELIADVSNTGFISVEGFRINVRDIAEVKAGQVELPESVPVYFRYSPNGKQRIFQVELAATHTAFWLPGAENQLSRIPTETYKASMRWVSETFFVVEYSRLLGLFTTTFGFLVTDLENRIHLEGASVWQVDVNGGRYLSCDVSENKTLEILVGSLYSDRNERFGLGVPYEYPKEICGSIEELAFRNGGIYVEFRNTDGQLVSETFKPRRILPLQN